MIAWSRLFLCSTVVKEVLGSFQDKYATFMTTRYSMQHSDKNKSLCCFLRKKMENKKKVVAEEPLLIKLRQNFNI